MKKLILTLSLVLFLAFGLILTLFQPTLASAKSNGDKKITICHATGSESNPFVKITINKNGWLNGHKDHQDERDFIVTVDRVCPSKNKEHEENPSTPETSTPTPEISKVIAPQIAAASISPEVAKATALPRGGGNSNLATSLMIGFGLILASALISQTAKKLKLA